MYIYFTKFCIRKKGYKVVGYSRIIAVADDKSLADGNKLMSIQ